MGQQNEKVVFEGHQQPPHKRRHIFPRQQHAPKQFCEIPGCTCALPHPEINAKICSACQEVPPPFLKTKIKPKYYEDSYVPATPKQVLEESHQLAQELPNAESIPAKIAYYNAWSLPIQKYQVRDRAPFDPNPNSKPNPNPNTEPFNPPPKQNQLNTQDLLDIVTRVVIKPQPLLGNIKQNMNLND